MRLENAVRFGAVLGSAFAFCALGAREASAAQLQQISGWNAGGTSLPADVTMYAYVPDKVATKPPVLTLIHYCGGTASAVFGQAAGLVKAADQYGFIIVAPSSGRCWDIVSDKTRTRDGGGDSHAIVQMVRFAISKYQANADRVYSTGDSSGGMMTELLLALYPDVFKAGSAFAGMPAGCRGANESGNGGGYSNACAGGSVTHTPAEWAAIVDKMDPGYTGHRPRVQLFHGDADTTIRYANFTEAVKEWTGVLALSSAPTATQSGITLGTHQATRQQWKNACGYVVLDAFTSIGGDHGPSDTLFNATYVVPFLGLDRTGPVDPEISSCASGSGGQSGSGGSTSTGGAAGRGGAGQGGAQNRGGAASMGGAGGTANGGASAAGAASGGTANGGAANGGAANGGAASGGTIGAGGTSNQSGGLPGSGGAPAVGAGGSSTTQTGGAPSSQGEASSAGKPSTPLAGSSAGGATNGGAASDGNGCSCTTAGASARGHAFFAFLIASVLLKRRRRSA